MVSHLSGRKRGLVGRQYLKGGKKNTSFSDLSGARSSERPGMIF